MDVPPSTSPTSPTGPMNALPKGFVDDLKAVLMRDTQAMMRVAKNPAYFGIGVALYALAQAAMTFSRWRTMQQANEVAAIFDIEIGYSAMDMLIQGVFGFVGGFFLVALMYWVATQLFKAKAEVTLKEFMTAYFFCMSVGILFAVPIVGFLAGIWLLVLVFTLLLQVFKLTPLNTLLMLLVSGAIFAVVLIPLGKLLGISMYSAQYRFDYTW